MRPLFPDPDRFKRWTIALGLVAIALALHGSVRAWGGARIPFLFFLPTVVLALLLLAVGLRMRVSSARASEAEQRLMLASEDTGIGIFDLDLAASTIYLSPALAALAGVDASRPIPLATLAGRLPRDVVQKSRSVITQKLRDRAESYERDQALAAGFDHHLTKPVDPAQLMQLIARAGLGGLTQAAAS